MALVRRNSNIDTDELERAIGVLKLHFKNEGNAIDAAVFKGGIQALEIILDGHVKTYEDFAVMFEGRCFNGVKTCGDRDE